MKEGDPRGDAASQEGVDEPGVEVEPGVLSLPSPSGKIARPGDRQPIVTDAERAHQVEVGLESVIMIAGHLGRVAAFDLAG